MGGLATTAAIHNRHEGGADCTDCLPTSLPTRVSAATEVRRQGHGPAKGGITAIGECHGKHIRKPILHDGHAMVTLEVKFLACTTKMGNDWCNWKTRRPCCKTIPTSTVVRRITRTRPHVHFRDWIPRSGGKFIYIYTVYWASLSRCCTELLGAITPNGEAVPSKPKIQSDSTLKYTVIQQYSYLSSFCI